jgi:hypothetical protein
MQLPQVRLISLSDFEKDDVELRQAKQNRSPIEYYFTCTPSLPLYILETFPEVDIVTYLDADLYFFSSIEPVYRELGDGSVLIIGHRFPPYLRFREIHGIYNVGMLCFRRDANGFACLHYWRTCCLAWCYDRPENGRYADQKYLDDWPGRFAGVVVLQHKGAGLAPWNLGNYRYSWKNVEFLIDGQPIIVYHFHGLKRINRWITDANTMVFMTKLPGIVKKGVYIPYLEELTTANHSLDTYMRRDLHTNSSIRVSAPEQISLKSRFFNRLKILKYPLEFYQKYANNDLILFF